MPNKLGIKDDITDRATGEFIPIELTEHTGLIAMFRDPDTASIAPIRRDTEQSIFLDTDIAHITDSRFVSIATRRATHTAEFITATS